MKKAMHPVNLVFVIGFAIILPRALGLVSPQSPVLESAFWGAICGMIGGIPGGILVHLFNREGAEY